MVFDFRSDKAESAKMRKTFPSIRLCVAGVMLFTAAEMAVIIAGMIRDHSKHVEASRDVQIAPEAIQCGAKVRVLTLTGWGQKEDALDLLCPKDSIVSHVPYQQFDTLQDVLRHLEELPPQDIVMGWSLGGKIASLAIARGILSPKLFVQISSSFQLRPGAGLDIAAGGEPFSFYKAFSNDPEKARGMLAETIFNGDERAAELRQLLEQDDDHDEEWLRWIVNARFGMDDVEFRRMPHTLIIHGANDALIGVGQAGLYEQRISGSRLVVLPGCGHAPHLHSPAYIAAMIEEEWAQIDRMAQAWQ